MKSLNVAAVLLGLVIGAMIIFVAVLAADKF